MKDEFSILECLMVREGLELKIQMCEQMLRDSKGNPTLSNYWTRERDKAVDLKHRIGAGHRLSIEY